MNKLEVSPRCAVELLEIIKYLDSELLSYIPKNFIYYLETIKEPDYCFTINKNINLYQNDFMDETKYVLSLLFKDL